jgi:uncharacterized membrane protein YeaQ/YmgE (transglycosylase-associated protein family)
MSVAAWFGLGIILGGVVGWLSGMRGRELVGGVVVGLLGGLIGGFLASAVLGLDVVELEQSSVLAAAVGAVVLVLFLRAIPPTDVFE